jgi:hypothetical protein
MYSVYSVYSVNYVNTLWNDKNKPLLILDLDGTLVGTGEPPLPRPGLMPFLTYAFQHFEVALWTAADSSWLQYVLDNVLNEFLTSIGQNFIFTIYRISSLPVYIKPLTYVWELFPEFNVNNTLIVDNTPITYSQNPNSGIFIPTFSDNVHDIMLNFLKKHLDECLKYYDKTASFPTLIDSEFEYLPENTTYDAFQIDNKPRKRRRSKRKSHRTIKKSHL